MRLTQVRDFVMVVECGSVRAAARKLGISQPTVTKSVRSLEAELHVQLLGRSSRGIVLTPAGRSFFARARVAHSELRKAEEEAAQATGASGGTVALGIGPVAIALLLPAAMASFRRQFPLARVRVVEGLAHALLSSVRDETLDFAVGLKAGKELDAAFKFRPLYRSALAVCVRRGHPLRHARSLAELIDADWLFTSSLALADGAAERMFRSAGLEPPQPVIRCESYHSVITMLAKTDMVGLLQRLILRESSMRNLLEEIVLGDATPALTVGIFSRADTPLTRAAAAMVKHLVTAARPLMLER